MESYARRGDSGGGTITLEPETRVAPPPAGRARARRSRGPATVRRARTGRAVVWGVVLGAAAFFGVVALPESLQEILRGARVGTGVFALLGVAVLSTRASTVMLNLVSAIGIFAWAWTGAAATPWGLAAHGVVWACNAVLARSDESVPSAVSAAASAAYASMALLTWVAV